MKVVLDACVLKLATLPNPANKAAFILALCQQGFIQAFVTPEILVEYQRVLSDTPKLLAEIQARFELCYPLFTAFAIRHEPDNRFNSNAKTQRRKEKRSHSLQFRACKFSSRAYFFLFE